MINEYNVALIKDILNEQKDSKIMQVSCVKLSVEQWNVLFDYLKSSNMVKELACINTNIIENIDNLFKTLRLCPGLSILVIYGEEIGMNEMKCISEHLKLNTNITELDIIHAKVGNEGTKCMSEILKSNCKLKSLTLNNNQIGSEGLKCLIECLRSNASIEYLSLTGNPIKDEGVKYLCDYLKTNLTLKKICLDEKLLLTKAKEYLRECLILNTTLTQMFHQNLYHRPKNFVIDCHMIEFDYMLNCNKNKWSTKNHLICYPSFKDAIHTFLLCMKRIQWQTKLKIPKFVLFEIIKFIDQKIFFSLDFEIDQRKKRKREEMAKITHYFPVLKKNK
jgi:Leucine-rich repeat (LRR) protein